MKNDLKCALDRSNTTAGKLSEVLGIVDKRDAEIARLRSLLEGAVTPLDSKIRDQWLAEVRTEIKKKG